MNDFEAGETAYNDPDSDYQIDTIEDDPYTLQYGLYSKLLTYLYHYNLVKIKYKLLALMWLLGTFVGFGYIISGKESVLPINYLLTITILSLFSSVGIFLLGFFDVGIYHRFVEAIFTEILKIEENIHDLSKACTNITHLLNYKHIGPVLFDSLYYISFTFILLIMGAVSLHFYLVQNEVSYNSWIIVLYTLFVLGIEAVMLVFSRESNQKRLFG